jgi:ribosomal protein L11 methyltransferase
MSWILVRSEFERPPLDLSPFIDIFREFGIENTLEEASSLQGCLVQLQEGANRAEQLQRALLDAGADAVSVSPYVEQDWEIAWRQFFKPRRVGKNFVVAPTWDVPEAGPDDLMLILDPGQAFGTGDHPTTRMCLELVEQLDLDGKRVADVGCGSGILGIAAKKLGAEVLGVDIDPVALAVTRENAERNGAHLELYCGDGLRRLDNELSEIELQAVPQDDRPIASSEVATDSPLPPGRTFNVIVSNIISATLIRLGMQLTSSLEQNGFWIVSGIIDQNWPEVEAAAITMNMTLVQCLSEDGWVAATFVKQPNRTPPTHGKFA